MPKITDIEPQKKNAHRSSIYIDGKFFAGASTFIIRSNRLEIGKEVDQEKLEQVLLEDSVEKAKGYIIDYHLNKSKKIIRDKLKLKEYEEIVIERVMVFLETYKIVDDLEYARKKSQDALHIGKKGKRVIAQTLRQNGVSAEDIEQTLSQITEADQLEVATKAMSSKVSTYRRKAKDKYDFKSKCYAYLMRRGFTSDTIQVVLEAITWEEDEEDGV